MKNAGLIGHNDLRLFLKSKTSYIWLFAVPLAFVYFMGFANRGPGDPANPKPAVLIDNQDTNFLSRVFLDELDAQGMRRVDEAHRKEAERGLRIPPDFTERVLNREQTKVEFFQLEGSGAPEAAMIELRLVRALIAINSHLLEAASRMGTNVALTEALLREVQRGTNPVILDARFAGRKPQPTGFNFSLPGNLVMYVMMNLLIFGGAALAEARRSGILRRLAIHPVTRVDIVFGKIYGLFLLGLVQVAFFLLAGRLVFGVNLGANVPMVLLTLSVFAWVAASLGVLIGSVVKSTDRVVGLCVLLSMLMAALGGCWWPLEVVPTTMKVIAHCLPSGWAMDALHPLISFGGGFAEAKEEIGVLALFGLGLNLAAARWFRV
jgi:ABC-type multidrug transport system permease subunit